MSVRFCVSVALVCALVVCALAPAVLADESPAELKKIGEEKKNTLLSKSQSRPLIPLNSIDFRRLVGDGPRPYDLVVFLTSKSGGCSMCDEMRPELELVANAFEAARWEGGENEGPKHDLFFVELDGSRNYELFQQLGLQTVPHLVFVDRANNAKKKKWDRLLHDRMGLHRGWQADGIIKMLGSRSPVRVKFERPPAPVNWGFWVLVLTSATGFITFFSTVGHKYIDLYLRNKNIYLVVALLAYAFCTAGGMYNHIQGTPFNSMEADGSVQLINPQSGTQFGAETYIVGFLNLIMAFCLILLNTRVLEMKTPEHSRVLLILACVFAFHFFFFQLRHIYTRKNGGYRWGWVWSY